MNTWVNFAKDTTKLCLNKTFCNKKFEEKNRLRLALELRTTLIFLSVCLIYSCRRLKRKSITNFYLFYLFIYFLLFLFSYFHYTTKHTPSTKHTLRKIHSEETCENTTSIIGNIALKSDYSRASQPTTKNNFLKYFFNFLLRF